LTAAAEDRQIAMTPRSFALACLPPTLWALCYVLAKPAIAHFPPLFMVALAYAASAVILSRKTFKSRTPRWAMFSIAAFGGSIQSGLMFWGLKGLPASTAVLVVQAQVPFAILCAWTLCGERPQVRKLLGVGIVFAGIVLVAGAPEAIGSLWPLAAVLLGTLSWGVSQAMIRLLGRDDGPTTIGALTAYAAPQMFALSFLFERGQIEALRSASPTVWIAVLVLAIGGYVVAYSIWYALMKVYRVDQVTPFALLMPVVGVLAGALLLSERLSTSSFGGGAIVLGGLIFATMEPRRT
jgi:O-acetylserine/cysteine efflux transporter